MGSFLQAIKLTHTDIKCRNVMLRDARGDMVPLPRKAGRETRRIHSCEVVVIDFGGAVFAHQRHGKRIGTRQYRAPEVVLRLDWDEKSDLWSLARILFTLYTGERPFPVREDFEHLLLMQRILACELPQNMLRSAKTSGSLDEDVVVDGRGRLQSLSKVDADTREFVEKAQPLCDRVLPQHSALLTLMQGLFRTEPKDRLSAAEAMKLPFVASNHDIAD